MMHEPIYPNAPGFKGESETSREAADALAPRLGHLQKVALGAIRGCGLHGCTADELAAILGVDRYTIQPRTSELRRKNLIVDSKLRRRNASGKKAIVWTIPEAQGELYLGATV